MEIINSFNTTVEKALEEIDKNYKQLPGLVVCGTHSPRDVEAMINRIQKARELNEPALLICFGHQLGAIEYARNVLGIKDATSEEFGQGTYVVKKRPEGLYVGLHNGETYWNNYEVVIDWVKPENFITSQFHPEYQSSIDDPHPLLLDFINKCKKYV